MDLIYADKNKNDVGVIQAYYFDLAFGTDENNFELGLLLADHCLAQGFFVYIDDTEYGGIIDSINVDTKNEVVKYKGRTWHGILANKVLEPTPGNDYLVLYGEANNVIGQVIKMCGLSSIFEQGIENTGIIISGYQFDRYCNAYDGLMKMLESVGLKLMFTYTGSSVVLSAQPLNNYAYNEEWDSSQLEFVIEKGYRPTNHLVCLGQGNLKDRYVIHLFTDANGGLQPYSTTDIPKKDSDYILGTKNKKLFGSDEVTEVYDLSNAEFTNNYIKLDSKPADWSTNYSNYYKQDVSSGSVSYKTVETVTETVEDMVLLSAQPVDWSTNYGRYYTQSGESVKGQVKESYPVLTEKPNDWETNYSSYHYEYNDGVVVTYPSVSGIQGTRYNLQTMRPSDWSSNYGSYYIQMSNASLRQVDNYTYSVVSSKPKNWDDKYGDYYTYEVDSDAVEVGTFRIGSFKKVSSVKKYTYTALKDKPSDWDKKWTNYYKLKDGKYVNLGGNKAPTFKKNTFYSQNSTNVAPTFQKNTYFSRKATGVPKWVANKYYTHESFTHYPPFLAGYHRAKQTDTVAPSWQTGAYYTLRTNIYSHAPDFSVGDYYQLFIDHYAALVAGGIEKLKEIWKCDSIDIKLDAEQEYDVGDIVGATESTTGISVFQRINKKIVTIENGIVNATYEIGGTNNG